MARRNEPEKPERDEEDDDDEAPWSEQRWEEFMRDSDLRSARFGEIFETVMDDPNRDRIIAKEMGWSWLTEALDEEEAARAAGELDEDDDEDEDEGPDFSNVSGFDDDDEDDDDEEEPATEGAEASSDDDDDDGSFGGRDCDHLPAYRLANKVGMKVHEALKPWMEKEVGDKDEDYDRRLGQAYIGCMIAAAKISGGHAMGYEDDVLCGNIANCKRGLAGARDAERALLELKADGFLPGDLVDSLLPDVRAVIDAVSARIEELRAKVWW